MKGIILVRQGYTIAGGIEGQIVRIARELASREILSPILVTTAKQSSLSQRFQGLGLPVHCTSWLDFPADNTSKYEKFNIFNMSKVIESVIKKHDVVAIQSHMFRESFAGRMIRLRYPYIKHVFRVHTYIDNSAIPAWRKNAYHLLARLTDRGIDKYVPITEQVDRELRERSCVHSSKTTLVSDSTEPLGPPDEPAKSSDGPLLPKVAMVSNFVPRKGHDVLIKGLALLASRGLEVQARLIGGESRGLGEGYKERLKGEAEKLGVLHQLEFYGYTEDVYEALRGYPVVVLPSDGEGLPNAIIEALSLRKLVVASHVGGIPEMISDSINGLLHPAQDPAAFADRLQRIFSTPAAAWEPIRSAGYETWRNRFSMDLMIEGLVEVYQELGVL